tara:strand:+ start:2123 stop:2908 length:786 start_codon:yes stop_codon:yes gene_type:complete
MLSRVAFACARSRSLGRIAALPPVPLLLRQGRLAALPLAPALCGSVALLAKKAKGGKGGGGKGGKGKAAAAADEEAGDDEGYVEVDLEDVKRRMQGAVDALQREYSSLNVGRASPTMLDALTVSGPNGEVPLSAAAKVLMLGPQALQVSVFDVALVPGVVKAIEQSSLGLVPEVAGKMVKVPVPRATSEARQEMVKQVRKHGDACREKIRNVRQVAMKKAKAHPVKDLAKRAEKDVEKLTEASNDKVSAASKAKEGEVLQV